MTAAQSTLPPADESTIRNNSNSNDSSNDNQSKSNSEYLSSTFTFSSSSPSIDESKDYKQDDNLIQKDNGSSNKNKEGHYLFEMKDEVVDNSAYLEDDIESEFDDDNDGGLDVSGGNTSLTPPAQQSYTTQMLGDEVSATPAGVSSPLPSKPQPTHNATTKPSTTPTGVPSITTDNFIARARK